MFVHDHVPVGLTQYNHLLFSQRLHNNRDRIAQALQSYFARVVSPRLKGKFAHSRFVVDFAVHPDAISDTSNASIPDESIVVIELNCFYEATGMGLFDYHEDRETLRQPPCEVRVKEAPTPHVAVKMENAWRDVLAGTEPDDAVVTSDAAWLQLERAYG